jgi:hypothetical protein
MHWKSLKRNALRTSPVQLETGESFKAKFIQGSLSIQFALP